MVARLQGSVPRPRSSDTHSVLRDCFPTNLSSENQASEVQPQSPRHPRGCQWQFPTPHSCPVAFPYPDTLWVGRKDQEVGASAEGPGQSWCTCVSGTCGPGCVFLLIIYWTLDVHKGLGWCWENKIKGGACWRVRLCAGLSL